jgi:hypothetical protein
MLIMRRTAKIACKNARILSRFDCGAWSNHEPTGLDSEALEAKARRPNIGNTARYLHRAAQMECELYLEYQRL